eukprot:TRINITY_DN13613_c0_g1_i1.p2 TRINITY_DN13613_c0_g1~~TRINITY_DN13613_c0_g1_i1.p2  ORF type:complete len:118 (-),score=3.76 TRINITY_DN13613_c0_g1_i1:164-517(-)
MIKTAIILGPIVPAVHSRSVKQVDVELIVYLTLLVKIMVVTVLNAEVQGVYRTAEDNAQMMRNAADFFQIAVTAPLVLASLVFVDRLVLITTDVLLLALSVKAIFVLKGLLAIPSAP